MTAPLKHSDPITVDVALGDRAYDIVIGRDVLQSLGARVAALRPGARTAIVTDRNVAQALAREDRSLAGGGRHRHLAHHRRGGRGLEDLCRPRTGLRGADRGEDRAQRSGDRARRRRGRRSRRLCGGDPAPRRRFRAGADLAAGAGRLLGRRQDRDQFAAGQESARRVSSAGAGDRRYRRARYAVAAPVPRRLCRSRQIRRARRRGVLRLAGGQSRRYFRRRRRPRTRHRHLLPRQGRDRGARRARDRRARAAQSRPYLRPRAGGRDRLFRPAVSWRRRCRRHGAGGGIFRATRDDLPNPTPRGSDVILPRSACRPICRTSPDLPRKGWRTPTR